MQWATQDLSPVAPKWRSQPPAHTLRPTEPVRQSVRPEQPEPGCVTQQQHARCGAEAQRPDGRAYSALWAGVSGSYPGGSPTHLPLPPLPDPLRSLQSRGTLPGQLEPSRQAGNCSQQALWLSTTGGSRVQSALLPHPVSTFWLHHQNQVCERRHHRFVSACLWQSSFTPQPKKPKLKPKSP